MDTTAHTGPTVRRQPRWAWATLGGAGLLLAVGAASWHERTWFDLNSGDGRVDTWCVGVRVGRRVTATAFARLARRYGADRSPPNWVFKADRWLTGTQTDGDVYGLWPADVDRAADVLGGFDPATAGVRAAVVTLAADLAADDRPGFRADLNAGVSRLLQPTTDAAAAIPPGRHRHAGRPEADRR